MSTEQPAPDDDRRAEWVAGWIDGMRARLRGAADGAVGAAPETTDPASYGDGVTQGFQDGAFAADRLLDEGRLHRDAEGGFVVHDAPRFGADDAGRPWFGSVAAAAALWFAVAGWSSFTDASDVREGAHAASTRRVAESVPRVELENVLSGYESARLGG